MENFKQSLTFSSDKMKSLILFTFVLLLSVSPVALHAGNMDTLVIPACISYVEPIEKGVIIDEKKGITDWTSLQIEIQCFFHLAAPGKLNLSLQASSTDESTIKVSLNGKDILVKTGKDQGEKTLPAGSFEIAKEGYYCIKLKGISKQGKYFPAIRSFLISGEASKGAQYNTQPRRNAASVHLRYPVPDNALVEWFYNEVTVPAGFDPVSTFYMANGFKRGYFGMQVNSETERRVIFSVWDSGNEAIDRNKVNEDNRVKLTAKGTDVVANDFGHEGTGGHSHWVYPWVTGQTYRFLLHAQPVGETTTYTGYFYLNDSRAWKLIASFRAPKDGKYLSSLYSFIENFWGTNGHKMRKAYFGNQWIVTSEGKWIELNNCIFSHDPTGNVDRKDYGAGVGNGSFYLFNGGFVPGTAKYNDRFTRPSATTKPDIKFPEQ
jgi:hypothetical protein